MPSDDGRGEHLVPKGILPAGHLVVMVVQLPEGHVLRVYRPRGNGKHDVPPQLLANICQQFDRSEMIRPGSVTMKSVGYDTRRRLYILLEVPLDEQPLMADPSLKTRWTGLAIELVSRSYEHYQGTPETLDSPAVAEKSDFSTLIARASMRQPDPLRVHFPQRSGQVGARA